MSIVLITLICLELSLPSGGNHLILEMPQCNSSTFQTFLEQLSNQDQQEFKILILDNGAFHHAKSLRAYPKNTECFHTINAQAKCRRAS
jgi:hypothetical protein